MRTVQSGFCVRQIALNRHENFQPSARTEYGSAPVRDLQIQCIRYGSWQSPDCAVRMDAKRLK